MPIFPQKSTTSKDNVTFCAKYAAKLDLQAIWPREKATVCGCGEWGPAQGTGCAVDASGRGILAEKTLGGNLGIFGNV
ncbi:MAG: hypothetical protein ACI8Q6_003842 [Granulosicoccus sp.]|jgi:hypothetical protein